MADQMTAAQAIRKAKNDVGELMPHGQKQYIYQVYDRADCAWRQSYPDTYAATRATRTRCLIAVALIYAGLDQMDVTRAEHLFEGGDWRAYVRSTIKTSCK